MLLLNCSNNRLPEVLKFAEECVVYSFLLIARGKDEFQVPYGNNKDKFSGSL